MDAEAREQLSRFSKLKTEIDGAYLSISTTELADALQPFPPALSALGNEQLDRALATHNGHSERVDQLNVGDLGKLRDLAKAASHKEMHSEDTDLVELTLDTLFAFDKLRSLLRQRSIMLNLHSLRLQWETQRGTVQEEETSLRHDVLKFIQKSRWSMPSDIATPKKRLSSTVSLNKSRSPARKRIASSSSNSNLMARRMRSDILSLDIARFSQRLHSLLHVTLKASGKTLDRIIDISSTQIPDSFLDLQEEDEDRVAALNKGTMAFLQALAKQWKSADEIAYAASDVRATSESTQREAESEILKSPTEASLQHYQSLLDSHSTTLTQLRSRIRDPASLPQPVHQFAPDQPEHNQQLVCTLEYLTDKSQTALGLARKAVDRYAAALRVLRQANSVKADLETGMATLQSLMRSILEQLARLQPTLDSPTSEEERLARLHQSLNAVLKASNQLDTQGQESLQQLQQTAIDPNITREMRALLDYHQTVRQQARDVEGGTSGQLRQMKETKEAGRSSQEFNEQVTASQEQCRQDLEVALWRQEWQPLSLSDISIPREDYARLQERLKAADTFARGHGWTALTEAAESQQRQAQGLIEELEHLLKVRGAAMHQASTTQETLQRIHHLDQRLQSEMDVTAHKDSAALCKECEVLLDSLHHQVPFIASTPQHHSLDRIDLKAHDATIRDALNKASMQLHASLERLRRHQDKRRLQGELDCVVQEQHTLEKDAGDLAHKVSDISAQVEQHTPQELKHFLSQLPSAADFDILRYRASGLLGQLLQLEKRCATFEDVEQSRLECHGSLTNLVQRIDGIAKQSQETCDLMLEILSEEGAKAVAEERRRIEEHKETEQAKERFRKWSEETAGMHGRIAEAMAALPTLHDLEDVRSLEDLKATADAQASLHTQKEHLAVLDNKIQGLRKQTDALREQGRAETRWPARAAAALEDLQQRVKQLEEAQSLAATNLHDHAQALDERHQQLTTENHLASLQATIADVSAAFGPVHEAAMESLDTLCTTLQGMPPLSDDPKKGKEALSQLHSALVRSRSKVRAVEDAKDPALIHLAGKEHPLAQSAREEITEKTTSAAERLRRLSTSARTTQETVSQHLQDLERQRLAFEETRRQEEAERLQRRARDAEAQRRKSALEDGLQQVHATVQTLEDGIKHIQKQQRPRDHQTSVLSRSLSASARSLRDLSQSASSEHQHLKRHLARTKQQSHLPIEELEGLEVRSVEVATRIETAQQALNDLESSTEDSKARDPASAPQDHANDKSKLATHEDVFSSAAPSAPLKNGTVLAWQERFEELSMAVDDLQDQPIESKAIHLKDLRHQLEELRQEASEADAEGTGMDAIALGHLEEVLSHQEELSAFHVKQKEAEQQLSDLLDAIDATDSPGASSATPQKPPSSTSTKALRAALEKARSAVSTTTKALGSMKDSDAVIETSDRLQSTLGELEEMAHEKLHPSPVKRSRQLTAMLTPTTGQHATPLRPSSRASVMSSATKSSRIPRVKSSMWIRSPTAELRRPPSPSAMSIRSEAEGTFGAHSRQSSNRRSYGAIATRRPFPPTTPVRRIPTSSSTGSFLTPDHRQRSVSARSLNESLKPHYTPASKRAVDQEVARVVNSLNFKQNIPIRSQAGDSYEDYSGRYLIGERLYFCRILRSRCVMIRVGGGWQELRSFLKTHFSHLLADQEGDISALVPRSPNASRDASLSFTRQSDSSLELLKFMSPERARRESSPGQIWR